MQGPVRPRGALDAETHANAPFLSSSARTAAEITGEQLLARLRHADPWAAPEAAQAPAWVRGTTPPQDTPHAAHDMPHFRTEDDTPVLLLDTRPSHIFAGCHLGERQEAACAVAGHVRGSINLQVPTLLLRRMRRLLAGDSPAPLPHDFSLAAYINTEAGAARLEQVRARRYAQLSEPVVQHAHFDALFDVYWFMDVVVLFEESDATPAAAAQRPDSSSYAGRMLLQLLETLQASRAELAHGAAALARERRGLYFVRGGLHAVRQVPGSTPFFASDTPPACPRADAPGACCQLDACTPSATSPRTRVADPLARSPLSPVLSPGLPPAAQAPAPSEARAHSDVALPSARRPSKPALRLNTRVREASAPAPATSRAETTTAAAPRHSLRPLDLTGLPPSTAPLSARPGSFAEAVDTGQMPDPHEFTVSTVIPGFLYFGPNIAQPAHVEALRARGVRAVLNTALEIEDGGAPELELRTHFAKYLRIPLRDVVEQPGVQQSLAQACAFLDRAWLYSCPTYVHCRAGKSRSAMVVMAYLIHAHRWTLQQAYAHVAAHREQVSPNIGFLAELMHFERDTHGPQTGRAPLVGATGAAAAAEPAPRAEVVASSLLKRSASLSPHRHSFATAPEACRTCAPRTPPEIARDAHAELRGSDGRYRVFRPALEPHARAGKRNSIAALGSPRPPQDL
ncbi:hypothetical protein MOBT1_000680 [Malassezia obtusa]|uniref:protein-tyrosine-phosphatase n=1 Tax=Malassezia obtusa TaxID=76774 RepID=A0AAF0IR32_9BASI|nr:hypothetical protein MOBT1_000680 [Malassezia obtusa]